MANEGVGGCETEAVGEQSGTPHRLAFPRAEKTAVTDAARPDATMGGNRHIWLVGDGRSGTTWACSLLNHKRVFCEYFEPLHVRKNANLGRTIIPYVRPGHVPDRLLSLYRALTQRTYASKWSGPKYAQNEPVIIKDIYALLACAAIVKAVPDIQPVLIARHPYEVAVSKMQLNNWAWYREPENLFAQRELVSDWLSPYEETIRSANTQFERYVVLWCLMYRVFMRQLDPDAYPVLRYNELNSGNLAGIADVFDTLAGGRTRYTDEALLSETFAKKTWTAKAGSRGGERPPRPSGGELERCQRFIEKFELNDFVASLGEPNMHDANSG